jgi:hypothetical protein
VIVTAVPPDAAPESGATVASTKPSSSRIVPVASASSSVTLLGLPSATVKVSSPSTIASPLTATAIVRLVVPAAKLSVPVVAR